MRKKGLKWYDWIVSLLVAIALINWPLSYSFNINLVEWIGVSWLIAIIYWIVGIMGLFVLVRWLRNFF